MNKNIVINDELSLYGNYTNYIYAVDSDGVINVKDDQYILFNPSIHYWVAMDQIGIEIYMLTKKHSNIKIVKDELIKKYNIDEKTFKSDVIPILQELLNDNFLTTEKDKPEHMKWMDQNIIMDDINKYPFNEMYISLSDLCNLNCIYCFNKEDRKIRIKSNIKLTTDKIIKVMEEFKTLGGTGVVFTGGEPTLNKDLLLLCREAKNIGLDANFITNGTKLKDLDMAELFDSVDRFGISLDSVVQKEIEDLWDTKNIDINKDVLKTLENINEYSKEHKKMNIAIMPIVSRINIQSIKKLFKKINDILPCCNVSWQLTQYAPIGNKEVDKKLEISEEDYIDIISKSIKDLYKESNNNIEDTHFNNAVNAFAYSESGKLLPPTKPKVITCAPSFFMANNGDVYPCQGFEREEFNLGNIYEKNLRELFSSEYFKEVRKRVVVNNREDCKNCELRFVCTNKCGGCITKCEKTKEKCREITVKRLYLQTKI